MISTTLFTISLLCFSLSTFSYRAALLAYIFIAATIIHAKIIKQTPTKISKRLIIIFALANIIILAISSRHETQMIYYIKFLGMISFALIALSSISAGIISKETLTHSTQAFIITQAAFFTFQIAYYLGAGEFIDFNYYIREDESYSLYQSRALESFVIPIRATGVFSEPSFYSMTVFPAALYLAIAQRKITKSAMLGVATSLLSLSIAAFAIVGAGIGLMIIASRKKALIITLLAITLIPTIPTLYEFYNLRVTNSSDYDAVSSRLVIFEELKQRDIFDTTLGSGFFWDEAKPIGKTGMKGYHTRDSSFYIYLFFTSGILGVVVFATGTMVLLKKSVKLTAATLIILFFKYSIMSASLWLLPILAMTNKATSRQHNRHV